MVSSIFQQAIQVSNYARIMSGGYQATDGAWHEVDFSAITTLSRVLPYPSTLFLLLLRFATLDLSTEIPSTNEAANKYVDLGIDVSRVAW